MHTAACVCVCVCNKIAWDAWTHLFPKDSDCENVNKDRDVW